MLSRKDNELLCRVGPGTPMGAMLREYWWPVLRSERLEAEGAPMRVRLLGEDYVAFRATDGRVGVLDEHCPHRRVSLMLARNEDCALRCILHGWKIDVSGKVIETPNEKEKGARLDRLKVRSLQVREAAGMVWVWPGEGTPSVFPQYAFNNAVDVKVMIGHFRCNWFQVMETLWDPAHVQILHGQGETFHDQFEGLQDIGLSKPTDVLYTAGFEARDEPFGFSYRFTEGVGCGAGIVAWIPTVMPCWVFITPFAMNPFGDRAVLGHVPVDDENMLFFQITYNMTRPIGEMGQRNWMGQKNLDNIVPANYTRENNWNQNRAAMREGSFTGIGTGMYTTGITLQDYATMESMGAITDRTSEQIGPADQAIVKGRRVFLDAVRAHMAGQRALAVDQDFSRVGREGGAEYEDAA
jgi:phenylpropionate dioxygenase-like ring-hydroxylating dioxygenase large terminal subunit